MSTTHRYQVMPDLSPEAYAALKADIDAHGVEYLIHVDEEDNTLDGFHRRQICEELGIYCPRKVIHGLTEAQKREHAWRMNLTRRQLTPEQKREIARTLREEGWTQERIAQALAVSQSTIGNWLHEFTNSGKLRQPASVQGKDGREYQPEKTRRRTSHTTKEANRPKTPQIPPGTGERSAQAPAQQETPQSRDTPAEAQSPGTELSVASGVPDADKMPPLVSDQLPTAPREHGLFAPGSGPVSSAENHAEAH